MKKNFFNRDRALAVILLVISAFTAYQATLLPASNLPKDPGSKAFPWIGCAILAICAIILFIKPGPNGKKMNLNKEEVKRLIIMLAIYLLFIVLSIVIGIMYTLPIILYIVSFLFSKSSVPDMPLKKRIIVTLIYTVAVCAALYLIYVVALDVRLKPGMIRF